MRILCSGIHRCLFGVGKEEEANETLAIESRDEGKLEGKSIEDFLDLEKEK